MMCGSGARGQAPAARALRSRLGIARARGRDAGYSLGELAVAMVVAGVLLGAVGTIFVGTGQAVRTVNTKNATGADVRLAIEAMTRTLKVATVPAGSTAAFSAASPTGMTFSALLNRTGANSTAEPAASTVTYGYSSGCLNQSITPKNGTTSTVCLLRTSTAPVFGYFASGDATATALAASPAMASADLVTVRSITLRLTATDPDNSGITGVPAVTRVSLENLIAQDGS